MTPSIEDDHVPWFCWPVIVMVYLAAICAALFAGGAFCVLLVWFLLRGADWMRGLLS